MDAHADSDVRRSRRSCATICEIWPDAHPAVARLGVRFLVDKNVSHRICRPLEAAGHDAVYVDDLSMASADDVDILERARSDAAVIVSSDTDFGTLLAAQRATFPSVILTREVSTLPTVDLAELIIANLPVVAGALERGAIVTVGRRALGVRDFRFADPRRQSPERLPGLCASGATSPAGWHGHRAAAGAFAQPVLA